jgi:hypothetical protein
MSQVSTVFSNFRSAANRAVALTSATALSAAALVAIGATPASAVSYESNPGAVSTIWTEKKFWTSTSTPWTFTIPSDASTAAIRTYATTGDSNNAGRSTYADTLLGSTLAVTGGLYDSNDALLTQGLSYSTSLGAFGLQQSYPVSTPNPCVPSVGCSFAASSGNPNSTPIYYYAEKSLNYLTVGGNIQPGNYTYKFGATKDGAPITFADSGSSTDTTWALTSNVYYELVGKSKRTESFPVGTTVRYEQTSCVDTSGLSANDSVTARWIEDGQAVDPSSPFVAPSQPRWQLGSQSRISISGSDPAISNSNSTIALSQEMIDEGLAFSAVRVIDNADGQPRTYDLSLEANGQEVSTSCAPAAPQKPSLAEISDSYSYKVSIPANTQMFGTDANQSNSNKKYDWEVVDTADVNTAFTTGSTQYVGTANPVIANGFTGYVSPVRQFVSGDSYKVRVRVVNTSSGLSSPWSEYSDEFTATGPAQMSAPTLSTITTSQATVTFPAVADTSNYKVYIYADSNRSVKVATQNNCYSAAPAGSPATCYVYGTFTSGTSYVATIARNATSNGFYSLESGFSAATIATSGGGGGGGGGDYTPPPSLFSLGGASVSGTFSVGSTLTATPNTWSRTNGGPLVTTSDSFQWILCSVPQPADVYGWSPGGIPCFNESIQFVLSGGTTIGEPNQQNSPHFGSTLNITEGLLNAMLGKHLMVTSFGYVANPEAVGEVFMKSCGPISVGLACVSGTPPAVVTPPADNTPPVVNAPKVVPALPKQALAKKVPTKAKAGKAITIAAVTKAKVATKVKVKGKGCKVTAVKDKKNKKKIKSYRVTMGKKGVTCTVTVTAPKTSKWAALKSVTKIKAT